MSKESRNLAEESILSRSSLTTGGASSVIRARLVKPMIAFMGVRISWDIRDRKSDFALLVSSAFSNFRRIIFVFIL